MPAIARLAGIAFLAAAACSQAELILIPRESIWKFYYNGPLPTNWVQSSFDDRSWGAGPGQLGYGDGDERTVLIDDPGFEPTAVYFRRALNVTNRADILSLTLRLLADDGAVVYLNGVEVLRRNMPAGTVSYGTTAIENIETNENRFVQVGIASDQLRASTNLIAVEVHQHPAGGHDCSFDLELVANIPASVPEVTITSPDDGAFLTGPEVPITADAKDADGYITRVDFYSDGVFVGTANTEPFAFTWTNAAPGRHALRARAFDNESGYNSSDLVHVQIGDVDAPVRLVRGPYLQCGSSSTIVVRWRTDWLCDSVLRFGMSANLLDRAATNSQVTAEHEFSLAGLQADTTYFYSVGSTTATFAEGAGCYFHTAPTNARPVRIWAIGDSGTFDTNAAAVRDAYVLESAGKHTDVWLMLGDNAYGGDGSDDAYQNAVFNMYPELLRRTVLWPALGNHDAQDSTAGTAAPFLSMFTLPLHAEAGGVPSGSELYYSFDYANAHFVCLDSFLSNRSTNGPMLTWLRADLASTDKDWIIGFWHHPPYSWGSHNSDGDLQLAEMRERALPILEFYGVDLVLCGHSHSYERSFLIDGHYGYSWELQPNMILDGGMGGPEIDQSYRKPAGGLGSRQGAVYVVCGCSGAGGDSTPSRHPVMAITHGQFGSMVIEISGLELKARFLRPSLAIDDCFTINKSGPQTIRPSLAIAKASDGAILSWPTSIPEFSLEWVPSLAASQWNMASETITTAGRRKFANVKDPGTNRFYRLRAQ